MNSLHKWPHIHVCALDWWCWKQTYQVGAPMRVHYKTKFWDIPVLTWYANHRQRKIWGDTWSNLIRKPGVRRSQ